MGVLEVELNGLENEPDRIRDLYLEEYERQKNNSIYQRISLDYSRQWRKARDLALDHSDYSLLSSRKEQNNRKKKEQEKQEEPRRQEQDVIKIPQITLTLEERKAYKKIKNFLGSLED